MSMKIYDATSRELMSVSAIERDGNSLVLKGKIFGAMPLAARIRPEEARAALKLLTPQLVFFLLAFLFLPSARKKA